MGNLDASEILNVGWVDWGSFPKEVIRRRSPCLQKRALSQDSTLDSLQVFLRAGIGVRQS